MTDKGYAQAQKVFEKFEFKNLGEYHDLYVQSDTLLPEDVFENFRSKCIVKNYVVHERALKQTLNHGLILKKKYTEKINLINKHC